MSDANPISDLDQKHAVNGGSHQQPSSKTIMPIAIVGMSCRFPGEASSVEGLWEMCCSGKSAWSEIPKDRMNGENYWHPNTSKHGSVGTPTRVKELPLISVAVQRQRGALPERRYWPF